MLIQRLLQLLLIAIVIVVAVSLLSFLLKAATWLIAVGLRVLVVLVLVAVGLRFVEVLREKSRRR